MCTRDVDIAQQQQPPQVSYVACFLISFFATFVFPLSKKILTHHHNPNYLFCVSFGIGSLMLPCAEKACIPPCEYGKGKCPAERGLILINSYLIFRLLFLTLLTLLFSLLILMTFQPYSCLVQIGPSFARN